MKAPIVICLGLLFLPAGARAQAQYRGGIVYGAEAAFDIAAPDGWVLDNESGQQQGNPAFSIRKANRGQTGVRSCTRISRTLRM
jgi:hypothetical protein